MRCDIILPGLLLVQTPVATVLSEDETPVADQDLVTVAEHGDWQHVQRAVRPQLLVHLSPYIKINTNDGVLKLSINFWSTDMYRG